MAVNIFKDEMQHAEMYGKPVLTTNWLIPRETVPDGWFCYDMRGTKSDPGAHAELVDCTGIYHSGTVLSPKPLKQPATKARRIGKGDYILHGETMDLENFCEEYGLDFPDNPIKFEMRPASSVQAPYPSPRRKRQGSLIALHLLSTSNPLRWASMWFFFRATDQADGAPREPSAAGRVGRGGARERTQFSPQAERSLSGLCPDEGGTCAQNYGYVVETDQYRYCLRCNPVRGDYQAYLTAFDKRVQELNQAQEKEPELAGGPEMGGLS